MNIQDELRRNRTVFERAMGAVNRGEGDAAGAAALPRPARTLPTGSGVAGAQRAPVSPAAQARGDGPAESKPVQTSRVYSLREPGPAIAPDLPGTAMHPFAGVGGIAAGDSAVVFPVGQPTATVALGTDPVDGLLQRLETDARLESQMLGELQ